MSQWEQTTLGEVCDVRRGTTITKKQTVEGTVPVIGGGRKPTYYHNESNREENCITVSGSGASAGLVNIWNEPIFASDCSTVEPKDLTQLTNFLYYYLCSKQDFIYKNFRSGAAQPHVYAKDIETIDYPLVPVSEQERIVSILDEAFEAIDTAIANTEKNLANTEELFQSILEQQFKYLDSEESEWEEAQMDAVSASFSTWDPRKQPSESFEYIDVSSVCRKSLEITETTMTLGSEAPSRARRVVKSGDVIFATIRPTLKRIAIIPPELDGAICSTGYFVIRPTESLLSKYVFYYLNGGRFLNEMEALQRGASYPAVSDRDVKNHQICFPSLAEQERIVAILDEANESVQGLRDGLLVKLAGLEELKQSVLVKAFAGELTDSVLEEAGV